MADTADAFPGDLALAALGGAHPYWQQGYRWGWEDAAKKAEREANPSPPPSRKEMRENLWEEWRENRREEWQENRRKEWQENRREEWQANRRKVMRNNSNLRFYSPETMEGYKAGQADYERMNG